MTKKIVTFIGVLGVVLMVWITASFFDTNANNSAFSEKEYAPWNFFEIFFGGENE